MLIPHWEYILVQRTSLLSSLSEEFFFEYFVGRLKCVGHFFAYVAQFEFLRDVWIRTQRATVASRRATNLATHLPTYPPILYLARATYLPT